MFDSHCHLDFPEIAESLDEHLSAARELGVEGWLVPGCGPSQWPRLASCSESRDVHVAVGIHPWWGDEVFDGELFQGISSERGRVEEAMHRLAREVRERGAVGIGECGLDRPRAQRGGLALEQQRMLFEAQLAVARELCLPVVLHVVGSHGAALEAIARGGALPAGGVVHGYSGSPELVERYLALGLFIGLGFQITRESARRARESLQRVPLECLLLETDAPDQAPSVRGGEGRRGRPRDLVEVVRAAAEQRAQPFEKLAQSTAATARRLFGLTGA